MLGNLDVTIVEHLWDATSHSWRNFDQKMYRLQGIPEWLRELTSEFIEAITKPKSLAWNAPIDPDLWIWSNDIPMDGGFLLPNAKIYALMLQISAEWEYLNTKWRKMDVEDTWKHRWKGLWGSNLTRRSKTFLWKICKNGPFTQERALKLRKGDGCCKTCPGIVETPEHIFYECPLEQWA